MSSSVFVRVFCLFGCLTFSIAKGAAHNRDVVKRAVSSTQVPDVTTTSIARGKFNSLLVVPGTKWCGAGNNALDYNDLGSQNATDACCRTHDHCSMYISSFKTDYNFYNKFPWTLCSCDCDTVFYNCLLNVGTTTAQTVGHAFFDLLEIPCINMEIGRYCAKWHWTNLFCDKYAVGPVATLNYVNAQTFDESVRRRNLTL